MTRRVAILAFEGCQPLDVVGPFEVFATATEVQRRRKARDPGYAPVLVSPQGEAVRGESGLRLLPELSLSRLASARGPAVHTLLVAGGRGARVAAQQVEIRRLVKRAALRAERVGSVCTGAFVLAAAGLLARKRATTHWAYCKALASAYPEVKVDADPIYVQDGSLWTSAGVTAGIDLALAMVEADLGGEVAMWVARSLVVFVRRAGGQSQFSAQLALATQARGQLAELTAYVVEHPEAELSVPELARRVGMSVRNFSRQFREQTGSSPADYVETVRVETARRLLESRAHSVERVAELSGFGTPESLRRAFARRIGLSPREYRARFGMKVPVRAGAPSDLTVQ